MKKALALLCAALLLIAFAGMAFASEVQKPDEQMMSLQKIEGAVVTGLAGTECISGVIPEIAKKDLGREEAYASTEMKIYTGAAATNMSKECGKTSGKDETLVGKSSELFEVYLVLPGKEIPAMKDDEVGGVYIVSTGKHESGRTFIAAATIEMKETYCGKFSPV